MCAIPDLAQASFRDDEGGVGVHRGFRAGSRHAARSASIHRTARWPAEYLWYLVLCNSGVLGSVHGSRNWRSAFSHFLNNRTHCFGGAEAEASRKARSAQGGMSKMQDKNRTLLPELRKRHPQRHAALSKMQYRREKHSLRVMQDGPPIRDLGARSGPTGR